MLRNSSVVLRSIFALGAIGLALPAAPAQTAPSAPLHTVYVRAGHLFDAASDQLRDNVVVVVEGERIAKVAPADQVVIPAGATVVDLSKAWVLPGLIDCHTHLSARADKYDPINDVKSTPFQSGFNGVVNAYKTLQAGFTSVRHWREHLADAGGARFIAGGGEDTAYQRRIQGAGQGERLREAGAAVAHESVQRLAHEQPRNAQRSFLAQVALHRVADDRALARRDCRVFVIEPLQDGPGLVGAVGASGIEQGEISILTAADLVDLLFERHAAQQVRNALL